MKTKHTQKKWIITRKQFTTQYNLELIKMGIGSSITNEEAEANRKLIESAPEMLELLDLAYKNIKIMAMNEKDLLKYAKNSQLFESEIEEGSLLDRIRKVITKLTE